MSGITLLGTGTCQIELERQASSGLIELDELRVLFDCGRGITRRLLECGVQPNALEHIVLSHFHPDHVSDLVPLLQAGAWSRRNPRTKDLHIYGPFGVQRFIDGLMNLFGATSFQQPHYKVRVHEVHNSSIQIEAQRFDFVSLPPAGNHGLRFTWHEKVYALTGDSHYHEEEQSFLRDVDLAIIDSGHLSDDELVRLAQSSRARLMICSHLYRDLDAAALLGKARAEGYEGNILVGRDLMYFPL